MKHSQIATNGITLHVVELGEGPPVLFCHGFPDLWRGWRVQMEAVAAAGYHAIAVDMRGYGRSSAPADSVAYTPFHTVADLVGLLDALHLPTVTIVGHDLGASVAWIAALLRPDRFTAVFGVSVPFALLGGPGLLKEMAAAGQDNFYMFDQIKPEAVALWADAAVTYPAFLYRSSGTPPPAERWNPLAGAVDMVRPAPAGQPAWADPEDTAYAIAEFQRTGFEGPLSYYRSLQPFFDLSNAYKDLPIKQPSFFIFGELDPFNVMRKITEAELRPGLPGLRGFLELPGIGHWPQHEATPTFNAALLGFLRGLD